jgi:hypothetical protein
MCCSRSRSARPRWAGAFASLLALALLASCSDPPTRPPSAASRPALDLTTVPTSGVIAGIDLGVLPGDVTSRATFVGADGAVYGRSVSASGTPRFFRWTQAGGMVQVSTIPSAPVHPQPAVGGPFPFVYLAAFTFAANAKGEATGYLCWREGCGGDPQPFEDQSHAFRYSAGAGAVELDTRRPSAPDEPTPPEPLGTSHGMSINKWGHVAGEYWQFNGADPQAFFWTPADSFRLVSGTNLDTTMINDIDQVIAQTQSAITRCSTLYRPDLGRRDLVTPAGECTFDDAAARAVAQQVNGPLVVGWVIERTEETDREHAALWRVPAPNRAAYPRVNASPIAFASRISLAVTGGRYHQLYGATQSSNAGPYVEVVDWGDGTSSRRTRATLAGGLFYQAHTYTKPGTYWVRVYVKDAQGRWGVDERRLTVTS